MWSLTLPQVAATLAATLVGFDTFNPAGERLIDHDILNVVFVLILVTATVGADHDAALRAADAGVVDRRHAPQGGLAARGATPSAFERRCIPAGCVAPPSNIPDILSRRALPSGRLAVLGATMDLHHGLLAADAHVTLSCRLTIVVIAQRSTWTSGSTLASV